MLGGKEEISISLLLRLDLEFLESTPKTLTNSLQAISRDFDTFSYLTITFQKLHKRIKVIVLAVTDMERRERGAFTIKNNFWSYTTGKIASRLVDKTGKPWRLILSDSYEILAYIPNKYVIGLEAEPDES